METAEDTSDEPVVTRKEKENDKNKKQEEQAGNASITAKKDKKQRPLLLSLLGRSQTRNNLPSTHPKREILLLLEFMSNFRYSFALDS